MGCLDMTDQDTIERGVVPQGYIGCVRVVRENWREYICTIDATEYRFEIDYGVLRLSYLSYDGRFSKSVTLFTGRIGHFLIPMGERPCV